MLYLFCSLAALLSCLVIDHINPIVKLQTEITDSVVHNLLVIIALCGYCPAIFIVFFCGNYRYNLVK